MIKKIFIIFTGFSITSYALEPLINSTTITNNCITNTINASFAKKYLTSNTFYVEYDTNLDLGALDDSIASIPCILTLMPIVWISNKSYTIDSMDEDLYHALNTLQRIFQSLYPSSTWRGSLQPKKLIKNTLKQTTFDNATLFSGGLDAVYTALTLRDRKQLLITIWGSDVLPEQDELWNHVKKQCQDFSTAYGQSHTWCKSNFRRLMNDTTLNRLCPEITYWWGYTSQALHYLGLIAPIAHLHGIPKLYIGSSHTLEFPYPYGSHPLIDNTIAYSGITAVHHGAELNRLQKIKAIKELCTSEQLALPSLRVCWGDQNGKNCLACEKCLRTILELLLTHNDPADFGLPVLSHTFHFMKDHVSSLHHNYFLTTAYHWNLLQDYIKDHVPHESYDANFKELCTWIVEQRVKDPIKPYQKCRLQPLQAIWKKSLQGTFTLDDLAILSPAIQTKKRSMI